MLSSDIAISGRKLGNAACPRTVHSHRADPSGNFWVTSTASAKLGILIMEDLGYLSSRRFRSREHFALSNFRAALLRRRRKQPDYESGSPKSPNGLYWNHRLTPQKSLGLNLREIERRCSVMNENKPWLSQLLYGSGGLVALVEGARASPWVQLAGMIVFGIVALGGLRLAFFKVRCQRERDQAAALLHLKLAEKLLPEHAGQVLASIGRASPSEPVQDRHPTLI